MEEEDYPLFYAYFEPSLNRHFYFNAETEETTWVYPQNAIVLDPDTQEIFPNPLLRAKTQGHEKQEKKVERRPSKILPPEPEQPNELLMKLSQRRAKIEGKPVEEILQQNKTPKEEEKANKIEENPNPEEKTIQNQSEEKVAQNTEIKEEPQDKPEKSPENEESATNENSEKSNHSENHEKNESKPPNLPHPDIPHAPLVLPRRKAVTELGKLRHRKNQFSNRSSIVIEMTDDGLPPLSIEIDETIANFQPGSEHENFSFIQSHEVDDQPVAPKLKDRSQSLRLPDPVTAGIVQPQGSDSELIPLGSGRSGSDIPLVPPQGKIQVHTVTQSTQTETETPEAPQSENTEQSDKIKYTPQNIEHKYLPNDTQEATDAQYFRLEDYAKGHFKKQHKGLFSRQTISLDSLVTYTTTPINDPLLSDLPDNLHKPAKKIFKEILEYTGASGKPPNPNAAIKFVHLIQEDKRLVDEAYFQLMKQTNGNVDPQILARTWEMFLILATLFPSSDGCQIWIKSHIVRGMQATERDIKMLCSFTYIRFTSRCSIGEPLKDFSDMYILEIPSHPKTSTQIFGCSLYEIMWGQRRYMPKCPIPFFLIQITKALIEKGATHREGIFRQPGNMKKVEEMVEASNSGEDVLSDASVDDLASLMKRWFRDMSELIVPQQSVQYLQKANDNNQSIEFAASLPPVHSMTLAYLIGFLQEMSKHSDETLMTMSNLAMVFAPNIVPPDINNIPKPNQPSVGKTFLENLIQKWDVSLVYPMKFD